MLRSRPARLAGSLALVLALGLSACGGDDEPTATTDDTAADDDGATTTAAPDDDDGGGAGTAPEDLCALVTAEDVGAVLGETVTASSAPFGCQYPGESAASLYPLLTVSENPLGAGGIEAAQSGAEAALGNGSSEAITVDGHDGYLATGDHGSQAAVGLNGLLVTATVTFGPDGAAADGLDDILTQLLELTIAAL